MRLYDNTRISAYRTCPRKYYFRHIRHWTVDRHAPALVFGGSWHAALDVVWQGIHDRKSENTVLEESIVSFVKDWTENGFDFPLSLEEEQKLSPRTPGVAADMLSAYIKQRWSFIEKCDLLAVEKPFLVPLDPSSTKLGYIGRRDKTIQKEGKVWTVEHKTTSNYRIAGNFAPGFIDSFSPNSQIDGYNHALHMEYGDKAEGVLVDGALVHKKIHNAFKFIPVSRRISAMDEWLIDTRQWIHAIEQDRSLLKQVSPDDKILSAFRKNTDSCYSYNTRCMYMDICRFHSNPTGLECPDELIEQKWSPIETLNLHELGIDDED